MIHERAIRLIKKREDEELQERESRREIERAVEAWVCPDCGTDLKDSTRWWSWLRKRCPKCRKEWKR